MQPLTRQETRTSLFSWWSDRNPGLQGPTINLHAVAKPLLKLMYHRQALGFIRKNRGSPLSAATLEMYSAYFPWNFVSPATKATILSELASRATASEDDARTVVNNPPVFGYMVQMFWSPDIESQISSCKLLGSLGSHQCTAPAILELKPCERLVSLLRAKYFELNLGAVYALSQIARWPDGARAIVDAKALDHVLELLNSASRRIRKCTCDLLGRLNGHESTAPAILELNLSVWFLSLLREPMLRPAPAQSWRSVRLVNGRKAFQ